MVTEFKKITFKPLAAGAHREANPKYQGAVAGRSNDILLFDNPDRGYRTTVPVVIYPEHPDPEDPTKTCTECDLIIREGNELRYNPNSKCHGKHGVDIFYANMGREYNENVMDYLFENIYFRFVRTDFKSKLVLLQATLMEFGKVKQLPQSVFDIFDVFFDRCRKRDCKVLFRHGYHIVQKNWKTSVEGRKEHERLGADEETMLAHVEQFAELITKNIDIIHKMSSGFIGSGGEMARGFQYPEVNYDNIVKAVVEKICVPNNLYYTVRYPTIKLSLLENEPNYKYEKRIGHNNDALWGETTNWGWCSGCYQYKHNFDITGPGQCEEHDLGGTHINNDWWEYVCQTSAYTPQSGEMYHNVALNRPHQVPSGMDVIKELAHQHYTSLSQWNGFIESGSIGKLNAKGQLITKDATMQRWIDNETVTPQMLDEEGIIYDPAWFCDNEGNLVHRNPYEFIRDHLGYRLSAKSLSVASNDDNTVNVELTINNFGFAAAFNLKSGFALLDENYNVVSTIDAGKPEIWYSHDPDNYRSPDVLDHKVSAQMPAPNANGMYYLAFYAKNTRGEGARLANDISFVNGYNILCEI